MTATLDKPWYLTAAEREQVAARPTEHIWFWYRGHQCCKVCVNMRRADGLDPPCKGRPKVTFRL
jgi:hypothetical protein